MNILWERTTTRTAKSLQADVQRVALEKYCTLFSNLSHDGDEGKASGCQKLGGRRRVAEARLTARI